MIRDLAVAFVIASTLFACGEATPEGRGGVAFTTWGEEYIEQGIPASAFADGWSVKFSKFLIVISNVRIADDRGAVAGSSAIPRIFDLVLPGPKEVVRFEGLEARPWNAVSYQIGPFSAEAVASGGATNDDRARLVNAAASVLVDATATKGAVTKRLSWAFPPSTRYESCEGERDGRTVRGVVVTNGGTDQVELTIHGDHLFYDDLQAGDAKLRFEALAGADRDDDGEVTLDELAAVRLRDIPAERGGYQTGAASNVNDLRAFVTALSRTIGHFRGEGECVSRDPASP
jgi:hypothetical protein